MLINNHIAEGNHRADGDAKDRSGRSLRKSSPGMHQHRGDGKARDNLEEDFKHLVHCGRNHISVTLAVTAISGYQTDKQDCRRHRSYAHSRIRLHQIDRRQPLITEEHDERENHADCRKRHYCRSEGLFLEGIFTAGIRFRNQSGKCNRQSSRGEREENIVYIIRCEENAVTVVSQNIAQRNLVDRAEQLHDHNTDGKDCRTVHEVLLFPVCSIMQRIGGFRHMCFPFLHCSASTFQVSFTVIARCLMLASDCFVSAPHCSVSIIRRAT